MSATALAIVIASLVLVGASVAAMAIGVMFRRPCLRGSCGGREVRGHDGESLSCATCPNRRRGAGEPGTR
ncbi:MAG: hypothetical protein JNL30_03240 [Rubrivivax sp.]|nr:hypothetical protein [Rubrivivax sp.]